MRLVYPNYTKWISRTWSDEDRERYAEDERRESEIRQEANRRRAKHTWNKICDILGMYPKLYYRLDTGRIEWLPNDPNSWKFYNLLHDFWTEDA